MSVVIVLMLLIVVVVVIVRFGSRDCVVMGSSVNCLGVRELLVLIRIELIYYLSMIMVFVRMSVVIVVLGVVKCRVMRFVESVVRKLSVISLVRISVMIIYGLWLSW